MKEVSSSNFGLLIAYIVPGTVALVGVALLAPALQPWVFGTQADDIGPTIGGFFYVTLASITLGMIASVIRWALIDTLHHTTGVTVRRWTDRTLHERLPAYEWLIQNHYRYYQFYGNSLVSILFTYAAWRGTLPDPLTGLGWIDASVVVLAGMFLAGSRNALTRYYDRAVSLLGPQEFDPMTNGGHPKPTSNKDASKAKPQDKPAADAKASSKLAK